MQTLFVSKYDFSSSFFVSNSNANANSYPDTHWNKIDILVLPSLFINLHPSMWIWNQFSRDRCEWTCYGCYVLSCWCGCWESWKRYVSSIFLIHFSFSFVYYKWFFRKRPGIIPKLEALRTLYEGKKIIVGRDKLEVVKGVLQKVSSPSLSL